MTTGDLFKQYMEHLFHGKRCESRELMLAAADRGVGCDKLLRPERHPQRSRRGLRQWLRLWHHYLQQYREIHQRCG